MNLHENKELFANAVLAASQSKEDGGLGVKQIFIEKDYWISRSLKMLSQSRDVDLAVFKGGTSISKAYGLGSRFSEDIDLILDWRLISKVNPLSEQESKNKQVNQSNSTKYVN